ncbi:helix-turn-helix domain-containing protein [Blautia faecicola]|uniref:XRE family transcriptional regulator n=1 Tax=Blautia faecicola TaxID=2509240 RepID=A0A4Q1RI10_9FIRM|nr:helix-turn-helix transcriptional regulator [Blautia faecicola]RXS75341.1 XRE family transcriptional regulator [Blautia faecicola]
MNTQALKPEVYDQLVIKRILSIMEQKQIKQSDLANLSNIGQSSLSKLLKGEMKLTLQHIFKICTALKIAPEDLIAINKDLSSDLSSFDFEPYTENGIINEQFLNEQIFIRDKNHPAFNGYKDKSFYMYLYSTISSESFLLTGTLSFDTKTSSFCKAKMTLDTGKTDSNNKPIKKCYSGELIISLTMGSCYCLLTNTDIGEICFLNFKHMFLFNQSLECRMGTISSTSSGGNRLPVVQRILISQKPLNIMGDDTSDLEFVKGQLRLNSSKILISKTELDNLQKRYENNQPISEFLENFKSLTVPEEYYLLEESNLKNISLTSDIKTKGIGILRDSSVSPKYSKVSSKTNEFTFEYICGKRNV